MHKSRECVLGNLGKSEANECCPHTISEAPQMMNTCGGPNTLWEQ